MATITIPEAQANLPEIVENLKPGEEVILTRNEQPVAKLIPISAPLALRCPPARLRQFSWQADHRHGG